MIPWPSPQIVKNVSLEIVSILSIFLFILTPYYGLTFFFGVLHQFFAGRIITPFVKLAILLAVERGALE